MRERLRGISRDQFTERDIQTLCMRLCEVVQEGLGEKVEWISKDKIGSAGDRTSIIPRTK